MPEIPRDNKLKKYRTMDGHEHWTRKDLNRPITIQTHIDPVPERIMKQIIQALNMDKKDSQEVVRNL